MTRTNPPVVSQFALAGRRADPQASVRRLLERQHVDGGFIASPDFAQYQYCWLRDASFVAYALDRVGAHEASGRYHAWVERAVGGIADRIERAIERQRHGARLEPEEMPPARFALDGSIVADDWPNFQIDGYGIWLWSLGEHLRLSESGESLAPDRSAAVERITAYVEAFALSPCFDVWEEHGTAVHTSTLGSVYAGLSAAARLLGRDEPRERAAKVREAVRARAWRDGFYAKSSESDEVDASALWLAQPFGLVERGDEAFARTVRRIADELTLAGGIRRYPSDVYYGSGAWPVLTASLGWYCSSLGDLVAARRCRDWIAARFASDGALAEQFGGEHRDIVNFRAWTERWGPPARELLWSHAMYVVLSDELERLDGSAASSLAGDENGVHPIGEEGARS